MHSTSAPFCFLIVLLQIYFPVPFLNLVMDHLQTLVRVVIVLIIIIIIPITC